MEILDYNWAIYDYCLYWQMWHSYPHDLDGRGYTKYNEKI